MTIFAESSFPEYPFTSPAMALVLSTKFNDCLLRKTSGSVRGGLTPQTSSSCPM